MLRLFRRWHRFVSILIALPFLITVGTGVVLMTRGFNTWVQPEYSQAGLSDLNISFAQVLQAAQSVPEAQIHTWKDISQIDIRPSNGDIRVRAKRNLWEIRINGESGAVVGAAPRRFSFLIALHEGAYFGPWVRYGIFLPSGLGVLFLLLSGIALYFQPLLLRNSRKGTKS